MKIHTLTLALCGLGSMLSAQAAAGDVVAAGYPQSSVGGGLYLIDAAKGTMTAMTGVSGDLKWSYSIDQDPRNPTTMFVGTNGVGQTPSVTPNIYTIIAGAGKVITSKKLNTVALKSDQMILDLCVVGNEIWFLSQSRLARMPLAGGAPTTVTTYTTRTKSGGYAMCTDGRYLYVSFDDKGYTGGVVYQVDPGNTKHWALIFRTPAINNEVITSLEMAADGQILVNGQVPFSRAPILHVVDIATSKETTKYSFYWPSLIAWTWEAVEDPKTRDMVILGNGSSGTQAMVMRAGKVIHKPFGAKTGNLRGLMVRRSPWLHRSGKVCLPSITNYPFFANSVPEVGNAKYALTLSRKGSAGGVLLIGANGGLKAPVSLAGLGMTGCELGVLPIVAVPFTVPASGKLVLPLPIPGSLGRALIDVQWIMTETGANKANLISGQVGGIYVR